MDKSKYRFEVEFIFGAPTYRIKNLKNGTHQENPLVEPVTEQTYPEHFEAICEAAVRAGIARNGDEILCTTFPMGSRRVESKGKS